MGLLNFQVQQQIGMNTCWAAVTSSISTYYDPTSIYSQCFLISTVLGGERNCCADFSNCDEASSTLDALMITNNCRSVITGLCSKNVIKNEIVNNNPIVLRVKSNDPTVDLGHVIIIFGFDDTDDDFIWVQDPATGFNPHKIKLVELELFYEDWGRIDASILLR